MSSVFGVLAYLWEVIWGWQALAIGLLGLNELAQFLTGKSWKWLHRRRIAVALALLFMAQGMTYRELLQKATPAPPVLAVSPVVAENPDHAGLLDRLADMEGTVRSLERELETERAAKQSAERLVNELQQKVAEITQQQVRCDQLSGLWKEAVALRVRLVQADASPPLRAEVSAFLQRACSAMSRTQCQAFTAAAGPGGGPVGYPFDDGGYWSTLTGKANYLARQIEASCR
jgi:hypothetical protein